MTMVPLYNPSKTLPHHPTSVISSLEMTSEPSSNGIVTVSLPHREANPKAKPPVWPLNSSGSLTSPLPAKCDRNDRRDGVCCKDLKDEDDRTLIDPDIIRDV